MEHSDTLASVPPSSRGQKWTRYLFLVGVCLYLGIAWYLGWDKVLAELLSAQWSLVATATVVIALGTWLRAWKWRYALGPGHDAVAIFFLSKATANWSPGRLGEFSPMLIRRHRTPKIGAWIMMDRLLEIILTLLLGLIGLALIRVLPIEGYLLVLAITVMGTLLMLFLITRKALFLWIAERAREESWAHRFAPRLPLTLVVTALTKCSDLWAVALLFKSFGHDAGFALVSVAKCALAIVSFLPLTPTATGVPHLTQAGLMNQIAQIPSEGLAVAIGAEVLIVSATFWVSFAIAQRAFFLGRTCQAIC